MLPRGTDTGGMPTTPVHVMKTVPGICIPVDGEYSGALHLDPGDNTGLNSFPLINLAFLKHKFVLERPTFRSLVCTCSSCLALRSDRRSALPRPFPPPSVHVFHFMETTAFAVLLFENMVAEVCLTNQKLTIRRGYLEGESRKPHTAQ
jgi:hypothetical protein